MVLTKEETRKIQFTGKSSYIISLPKKWIEDIGLKAGDNVAITRQGHSLLQIGTPEKFNIKRQRESTIRVRKNDDISLSVRKLIALYILGFNIINVKGEDGRLQPDQRKAIKEIVRNMLLGTEITADSSDGITIQVMINIVELSVDGVFKRMLLISKSMLKDAILALEEFNSELANEVIKSDDEVDRFSFCIIRQLNIALQNDFLLADMGLVNLIDCLGYRLIVKSVERAADHATNIATNVLEMKEPLDNDIIAKITNMSNFALDTLDDACLSLFKRNYEEAERAIEKSKKIVILEKQIIKNSNTLTDIDKLYRIKFITESIRRIAEYSTDIAEIVLNMNVERTLN